MKALVLIPLISSALFLFSCIGSGNPVKKAAFNVYGNCDMCKARIEKACKLHGVSNAVWNPDSKMLTFWRDTTIVSSETVLEAIADAGYDNEKFYGDDYAYQALPMCCHYDRRPLELK